MKASAAVLAVAFAAVANAQSQCLSSAEAIPSCGQSCLTAAGSSYGCVYTDFACQCSHSSQINNGALTQCVLSACSDAGTALSVSSAAAALCSCVSSAGPVASSAQATAAIPSTTHAISVSGPGVTAPGNGGSSAAATTPAMQGGNSGQTSSVSMFTGGAGAVAGSIGGIMAGLLGLIAAL